MRKIEKIKERILSIVLTCAMMATLLVGIPPIEVHAEDGATLTYEVVGGTGSMEQETLTAGESFTLPEPSFTPNDGRVFFGWVVFDEDDGLVVTGYSNTTILENVEAGKTYKAIAYYGYTITVNNLPDDTEIIHGSMLTGNLTPIVVPEFTDNMLEANAFIISNSSMTSAPSFTGENGTATFLQTTEDGEHMYLVENITGPVTLVASSNPPATDTYELTIDCAGFTEDAPLTVITFDSDGYDIDAIEVANGDKVEIPVGGSVMVTSTTPNFKVAVENNLADVSDLQQGDVACSYVITNIQGDITIVIESITQGGDPTYNITLDRTNYADGYVDLYTYDSEGSNVANTQDNNATITMPEGGKVRVFADSEFAVTAEGATISEMLSAGDEGYYYELTGITADTTVVVNKGNTGSGDNFIDTVDVNFDWQEVPLLVNGSRELPSFSEATATVTVDGAEIEVISWGIKVTDSLKITEEDDYYNEALATAGAENINAYNSQISRFGKVYGWAPLEFVLSNPYYKINENDVYAAYVGIVAEDGKCFGTLTGDEYLGNLTCNVEVGCKLIDSNGEALVVFFELGTLAEMEEEKNEAGGTPVVTAPIITSQPQNISVQEGQKATFSVTATGDNLSYQWQIDRNDGNGFVNLSGATSASYTISTVDMDCNGFKYQCIVSNEGGSVTTNTATLTVTEKPSVHTHSLTQVPAKAATCTETGNKAYYTCSGCDSLFADVNGTTTTTAEAVKIAALGHDWSGEWTIIKEATATEEGKKETLCVRGCGQKKVVIIPATGTTDDNANLEKDAEVEPEAPIDEATLDNSKEELLEAGNIFTDAEETQIENGTDARVWLEISKTDEGAIASTNKAKIEQEANKIMGDNLIITYFDADLFKQVGTYEKTPVPEPGIAIKITITIPDELLNSDKTVSREYKIIRLHDGQVDVINGTFDVTTGGFTFESDKFSTYAIVYKDVPVNDDDNSTPEDDEDNSTSGDNDVVKQEENKLDEVPKTGESNVTLYSFILMLLSGVGFVICSRKKKI